MMGEDVPTIGLAELAAGRVGTVEAVTIVREIANRIAEGTLPGVPSPQVIRLTVSGSVAIEGPIAADARTVAHAAYLLETLLPTTALGRHVPGALRLIVARAMGTLDLPLYPSLGAFADALARFAAPDATLCIQALVLSRTLERVVADPLPLAVNAINTDALTISDIRRARRATGLTLTDVSDRTGIPAPLLCELEWGYLRRWPAPGAARQLLLRYARATGLDDELVLRTVWPILEEEISDRDDRPGAPSIIDAVPVDESDEIVPVVVSTPVVARHPGRNTRKPRRRAMVVAVLAIPALLVIGIAPSARSYLSARRHAANLPSPIDATRTDTLARPPVDSTHPALPKPIDSDSGAASVERVAVTQALPYPPAFTSVGNAIFQQPASKAPRRAEVSDQAAVLKITSVTDDRARNFHARLSPDGRQIAFDSDRDGRRGVYVADKDGRHVRRLSGEGFAAIPTWSPGGQTLAFVRAESDRPEVWNLWTATLTGGQGRQVTGYRAGQVWGASWFPDGKRIAFSHEGRAIVMNLSNGATRTYSSPRKDPIAGIPAVSPDGTRALIHVTGDGTWVLDFRTGVMKKIVSDPSADDYTWSPDGRRVAYHSRATDTWGVWIMPGR